MKEPSLKAGKVLNVIYKIIPYVICLALIVASQWIVYDLAHIDLHVPFHYFEGGDGASTLYRTFEMATDHTMFEFNQLGAPYGSNTYDNYAFDLFLFFIQYTFANVIPDYAMAFNMFVLATAWFNGLSSLYAMRRLKIKTPIAVVLSVLFGLLPFFFYRFRTHTYLTYYFAAPVAICMAIEIYRDQFVMSLKKASRRQTIVNLIWLVVIGMTGMYHAVFSCIFILLAGLLRCVEDKSIKKFKGAFFALLTTFLSFVVAALPTILYWAKEGPSQVVGVRKNAVWAGEYFSLRLTELVLPIPEHRRNVLSALRNEYGAYHPSSESFTAALGFVFTVGLVIIFCYLFRVAVSKQQDLMRPVSLLTVAALLIAFKGGLSTFFARVFPFIRCYNRMSVYIAFLCALAVAWLMSLVYEFFKKKVKIPYLVNIVSAIVLLGVVVVGVYDQSPTLPIFYDDCKFFFDENKEFVGSIISYADELDPGDEQVECLYLPHFDFPENHNNPGGMVGYEPMLLLVQSERLSVSFGAMEGRGFAEVLDQIPDFTTEQTVELANDIGYDGIIVAKIGMGNINPDYYAELTELLGAPDFENSRYFYWSLED